MGGGHTVPIEKIVSRYVRSMSNLSAAIRLADRVYLYDNSVDDADARLCARTQDGSSRKVYGSLPEWVGHAIGALRHHEDFVDMRAA
jgi:predicted ABC-type ATPase